MLNKAVALGDKIELTTKTELVESDTYYSMVYDIEDDEHMLIQAPIESGRIVPLKLETIYYACIYTDRGLYRGEVEVSRRLKEGKLHYMELTLLTPMKKYQRRQYYRMNCILNFQYSFENEEETQGEEWQHGTLLDISGGGIRFTTKEEMRIKSTVNASLTLALKDTTIEVNAEGTVLQSKAIEPDNILFQNRIIFNDLSLENREKIIKFIFEEERRRRKKEKGM